jgi:hypothetical protein
MFILYNPVYNVFFEHIVILASHDPEKTKGDKDYEEYGEEDTGVFALSLPAECKPENNGDGEDEQNPEKPESGQDNIDRDEENDDELKEIQSFFGEKQGNEKGENKYEGDSIKIGHGAKVFWLNVDLRGPCMAGHYPQCGDR